MHDSYGRRIRAGVRGYMYFSPGLSLMAESLSAMAELPMVVIDVQRSGPSTGGYKSWAIWYWCGCYNAHELLRYHVLNIYRRMLLWNSKKLSTWQKYLMSVIFMPDLQQGLNKQSFDETVYLLTAVKWWKAELPALEQPNASNALIDWRWYFSSYNSWHENGLFLSTGLEHNEEGR